MPEKVELESKPSDGSDEIILEDATSKAAMSVIKADMGPIKKRLSFFHTRKSIVKMSLFSFMLAAWACLSVFMTVFYNNERSQISVILMSGSYIVLAAAAIDVAITIRASIKTDYAEYCKVFGGFQDMLSSAESIADIIDPNNDKYSMYIGALSGKIKEMREIYDWAKSKKDSYRSKWRIADLAGNNELSK